MPKVSNARSIMHQANPSPKLPNEKFKHNYQRPKRGTSSDPYRKKDEVSVNHFMSIAHNNRLTFSCMGIKVSSLVKVFGIAAAGFVPQAQANPFGISFVKVDPPKDKKERAICFRLKLSQTDVFSEHNFTDITFRPDTTVSLQKQMLIDDEEEILKKTFKNFNAEKDPFDLMAGSKITIIMLQAMPRA